MSAVALTREDLIAELASMPLHARGVRTIERLTRRVTTEELRFELAIEAALMDGLAADPEYRAVLA